MAVDPHDALMEENDSYNIVDSSESEYQDRVISPTVSILVSDDTHTDHEDEILKFPHEVIEDVYIQDFSIPNSISIELNDSNCLSDYDDLFLDETVSEEINQSNIELSIEVDNHSNVSTDVELKSDIYEDEILFDKIENSNYQDESDIHIYQDVSSSLDTYHNRKSHSNVAHSNEEENGNTNITRELGSMKNIKKVDGFFICEFCNFKTRRKLIFQDHSKNHCQTRPSTNKNSLSEHIKTEHNLASVDIKYSCHKCTFTSNYESSYQRHLKKHSTDDETTSSQTKNLNCNFCRENFIDKISLRHHILSHHKKDKRYHCSLCTYVTDLTNAMKLHVLRHMKKLDPSNAPDRVNMIDQDTLLKYSNADQRKPIKKVECDACTFKCTSTKQMNAHKKKVHPNKYFIKCSICDFQCESRSSMHDHLGSHSSQYPFACSYKNCNYRTNVQYRLKYHSKSHELKETLLHSCSKCNFTARRKSSIVLHMRKHGYDCQDYLTIKSQNCC